nr:D-aminoacyl-tRNA deacylase [Anaerolineaceae bacterium]
MRAVIQRVNYGRVVIDGRVNANIAKGLVILLGIGPDDDESKSTALAKKIAQLRIMEDAQGKMNLSLLDTGGEAIV